MASEVSVDLNIIHDEDVLRRMWQQTDDFGRKKEIRQRMYKLREQRLRDFYTGDNSDMTSRKHAGSTYTDSIADQGFMSLKSKEIRDSESPTRDIHKHQGDSNYWNTVQQSSYSDDGGVKSYERSSTGTGQSADGATKLKLESDERGFAVSNVSETENAKTISDKQQHDAHIATASHTKTDFGEAYSYSTSQEHQESSSAVTESKDANAAYKSNKWETSSVSSASSRKVISSSNYGKVTSDIDLKALTSEDDVDFSKSFSRDEDNTATIRRIHKSSNNQENKYQTCEESNSENRSGSRTFIDSETRNNIKNNLQDINVSIIEDHFADRDSRRDSTSTYTSELTSNVDDYVSQKDLSTKHVSTEKYNVERNSAVVDQNIMTEINKLDTFLSTQHTGTNTPASPHSVMGEVNWTVVSNNDGEFVYGDDKDISGSRATPVKQPDNLDFPKECTEGQYMTTYNEHYTSKRISVDVSPTHDKFARSLRQTPPETPRSLSRQSLDRSSPERKTKGSPRSSPDKERRVSTGSYTIERPGSARRKSSEVTRQTATSRDSTLKTKRKLSSTQNKATTKVRTSTPGTSPSTSPSRKHRERSESASSASDSDASQVINEKKITTNIHKRADVVRKNLMKEFHKESIPTKKENSETPKTSSRPSSPEKSPSKQTSNARETNTSKSLRRESITSSKVSVRSTIEQKISTGIAPHLRGTSPEYSSEGSVGKEIKNSQRKATPDSSPDRAAFTPIKQFRTSPEESSETIQVIVSETDRVLEQPSTSFITNEKLDAQQEEIEETIEMNKNKTPTDNFTPFNERTKENEVADRKHSQNEKSPSSVEETDVTRKITNIRKDSTNRGKPSNIEDKSRAQSPSKNQTTKKSLFNQRSPSPTKERPRSVSPTKIANGKNPHESTQPQKSISRSPSPAKKESVTVTTSTTTTRKSSLKKESSFKDSLASRKFSRENTSSPVKQLQKSRSPSPEKQSPERKSPTEKTGSRSPSPKKTTNRNDTSSPTKSLSPSPQRGSSKRSHHLVSSPSISPCSSPERSNDKKQDKPKILHKTISKKSVDLDTQRTTRRSSIPRAEQSTVVRKTVETKIEIRSKPVTKIASPINKPKSSTSLKITKTDSQNSMDRTVSLRSHSTTLKKTEDKPKEPIKKTNPTSKKIVTTTAVISVQKPSVPVQTKHITTTTVARASTYKRTPSKEITPKKTEPSTNKKPIVTTTTKRIASRTNTPKSSKAPNQDETIVDTVTNDRVTSDAFIERLRNDESVIHGYKDETINFEITDLEDETRPELYPETEEDEEISERQDTRIDKLNEHHKTEKTILVDSKPKATSQFVVTIKKPTPKTPSTRPVTIRSSSGPIKGSPHASAKPTQTKGTVTKRNVTSTVQKSESLNMIRTKSDKSIPKTTPQSREVSKPEISTGRFTPANKASPSKQVTETGIASRNITTARSATMKRVTPTKKRPADYQPSSSEDEGQNIPSVVTPNRQEQQYIEELEEMRRNEELEYASKLTATTNQENQLLSVIVQHPKSSRESSPDMSNKSQPFCTVSDDGGSNPRYADIISEPEDVEVFNPKEVLRQPRFEQVTDLDEESEAEEIKLDVSVADRVSHFLETSKNHAATHIREDVESELSTDKAKNVLKAAAMFETIARNQTAPPAPSNKAPDILSRPSVFEARKGQTAPKTISPDIPPRVDTVNEVQMTQPAQVNHRQKEIIDIYETDHFEQVDISKISDSPDYIKPTEEIEILKYKKEASDVNVNPLQNGADTNDRPEKTPKTDPTSRTVKIPSMDKKKIESPNKSRPFEKTISASAEISSKRAFFERKAQTDTTTKQTKAPSMFKERKPLTESVQNKENIRGSSPTRKSSKMTSFIENERKTSRTSPERKTVSPERKISETSPNRKISKPSLDKTNTSPERRSSASPPAKERKHSVKSESPERKMSFTKSVKERRSSFTKEDITTCQTTTLQNKVVSSKNQIERKISPSRESPERRAPITQKLFPDHVSKVTPDRDITELKSSPSPVKDKSPVSPESPERSFSRKISRTSPERSVKSPERRSSTQNAETETVELNKAGKFGVTLRRTSSTTSAGSPRRSSVPGETQEIEEVTDMTLLEIMMEKAVGYEQRRRIRAQMRIVKKILDDKTNSVKVTRQKSPTRSPSRQPTQHTVESKKPERRPSSPNKQTQESLQSKKSERRPSSPTKQTQESFEPRKSERRPSSPTKQTQESFEPRKSERRPSSPTKQTQESLQSKKSERRPSSPTKQTQESFEPRKSERRPSSPTKQTQESFESKKPDRRPSSPTKSVQEMVNVEQKVVRKTSKPSELKAKTNLDAKQSPSITNGYISPQSPGRASPTRKESTIENFQGVRKNSKTETEVTSVRSQKRVETLVESGVDCITSSYGVGPTDENGRPLFGLRALRRTNTNKQLTDDNELVTRAVEERKEVRTERTEEVVRDTNGRPLFGGLRALRAKDTRDTDSDTDCWDMPEQTTSTQLRELVQRHEKVVRETNGPQDQPRQKPRAKLRDSFILTDDEGKEPQPQTEGHLSEVNNLNRGLSLKSIIQKHENISTTGGVVQSEVESSHTVVSSRTAVASDGTVSHSRDVIRGEMSAKNGEEPVGKVTRSQYTYKSPRGEDEGVNKLTTTTTTLGGRRTSGPKITEVEDDGKTKRSSVTEETSGLKVRKSSLKKVPSEDEKSKRRFSSQENEETKTVSKISSTAQKFTIDDSKTKFSTESRTKTSSPTLRRQKSSDEETVEEKKKIVRGDSVRALQHKFQQATENSSNNASGVRSTSARAGLILRTSSFTSTAPPHKSQESVSSTLKQSTPLPAEKKSGRQSPDKRRESPISDTATARKESLTKSSSEERRESLTTTRVSGASSFLDNTTKVTGVQDILSRMRNADLVNESGDTDADREARALLNKFLGASVILQGLEQGARGANISDVTPGSAALVSSVEKQRVATTRQKEEDIENIWDEQVLKNLLEQCTDYDGRRKLRARLRTVMAEHKACADLIALTGDSVANSESSESRQVTTRTEGNSFTRTEVHTRTSTNRLTKASSVSSPFAKFRQLERQNSAPSVGAAPLFRVTDPRVARSASSIKDRLLSWVQAQTREYKNIQIENFSTSWNNGLAFCALIHHFCPNAFDYDQLTPEQRRHNFELAFRVAEEEAGIAPLLDVEDMVVMRRPDWKCVFTYVQSVYRRFHSTPEAVRC